MEDDDNSWVRRAKFSHTVYHRLDSSKFTFLNSFNAPLEKRIQLKSRSEMASLDRNPSMSFQRSPSPLPKTHVSALFEEAQTEMRRFSSPHPQRKEPEKEIASKVFNKEIPRPPKSNSKLIESNTNKAKNLKESSWTKCFDHGGGRRVTAVEATDGYLVELSMLFIGLRFAHGAHSRLYHGVYKDQPVAVKIIRVPDDENNDLRVRLEKQFNREVTLLSHLCHQNVIRFIAACREPPIYCVITEYLSEGSLRAYLHKLEHKSLPLDKLLAMALDIARGMEYIHSQGVIHRDLKPENVLISTDFHMKIVDFGIACEEAHCDSLMDDPGTFRWMAPEMIKRKSYGRKVDVYSFGLILWEMVAGKIPYEDMTPIQAAFAVVHKNLRPVIPADTPAGIGALIEQCWSLQPQKRPEFSQVVKVLEKLEESLLEGGSTLSERRPKPPLLVETSTSQDHHHHLSTRKGLLHWIQKLSSDFHG